MKRTLSVIGLVGLLVVAGCKPSLEKLVVGKYKGSITETTAPTTSKPNDVGAALAKGMMDAMSSMFSLELREDKTFTLTAIIPIEGKWSISGDKITMIAEKFMGMTKEDAKKMAASKGKGNPNDMDKPMVGIVSEDGMTITMDPQDKSTTSMTFKKEAPPAK